MMNKTRIQMVVFLFWLGVVAAIAAWSCGGARLDMLMSAHRAVLP